MSIHPDKQARGEDRDGTSCLVDRRAGGFMQWHGVRIVF